MFFYSSEVRGEPHLTSIKNGNISVIITPIVLKKSVVFRFINQLKLLVRKINCCNSKYDYWKNIETSELISE